MNSLEPSVTCTATDCYWHLVEEEGKCAAKRIHVCPDDEYPTARCLTYIERTKALATLAQSREEG